MIGALRLLAAAIIAVAASIVPVSTAAADTVTVPFVDRLGCGASDAAITPVFGFDGAGSAADGDAYSPDASASAYPGVTGSFENVDASGPYSAREPNGYGSDGVYRGMRAFALPNPGQADGLALTIDLPHAQAIALTVGGIQPPSIVEVVGRLGGTPVSPSTAARASTPGSATASVVGGAARVVGASATSGPDDVPERAADVWFSSPVDSIEFRFSTSGGGLGGDNGLLITPPIACQSGAVALRASAVGEPSVDERTGRVSYAVPLTTTVTNSTRASGAALYPAVESELRREFAVRGISLDALTPSSASSPACALAADAAGTGRLISSPAALAPGATCTLVVTARVSMPSAPVSRTAVLGATLASSTDPAARVKATSTGVLVVFPASPRAGGGGTPGAPAPVPDSPSAPPSTPPSVPSAPPSVRPSTPPDDEDAAPSPVPRPSTAAPSALPIDVRFAAARIQPGTASTMRGTLGPNRSSEVVTVRFDGTVNAGMSYRDVTLDPEGECEVTPRSFSCVLILEPGQAATVSVRLAADGLNAPDTAVQQLSVGSSLASQSNAVTVDVPVREARDSTAPFRLDMSSFPGAFLPLLALLLLALASRVVEAKRKARVD